jgi:N-methylhydantoinase A/oxoprolinase/acetone carboxylase beta subunit
MAADFARRYPVLTFASGPTNSMRGAAYLSGLRDALVVDVGGTTADIGQGFSILHAVTGSGRLGRQATVPGRAA